MPSLRDKTEIMVRINRFWLIPFFVVGLFWAGQLPARADFRLCNLTSSRVGVAIGYKTKEIWRSEGWWNVKPTECQTLITGNLSSRYYYIYAQDYDRGGDWSGTSVMCTQDRQFTIDGIEDCLARGFDRQKFQEVDTGEQKTWTVQLTDSTRLPAK
jgi:uncharacterized membrane protein